MGFGDLFRSMFGSRSSAGAAPQAEGRDSLMAVLRESEGANKADATLVPMGPVQAMHPNGQAIEMRPAWFSFLGDTHIRFVYDGPHSMRGLSMAELEALQLDPAGAIELAVANHRRAYGPPQASPWTGGLMQVSGGSPDLDSSYFLDTSFWNGLLTTHPEGLVVAVPKRGGLLFCPLADVAAVENLRIGITELHATSESMRVSSALFLFEGGRWRVFQEPLPQR